MDRCGLNIWIDIRGVGVHGVGKRLMSWKQDFYAGMHTYNAIHISGLLCELLCFKMV